MNRLNQWKHWPAFWHLVREHDVCPESDKERLGECELCKGHEPEYSANDYAGLCCWEHSGFAGEIMEKLSEKDKDTQFLNLSTYAPKTSPLPIVKPCHRCGENHDEANPPPYCVKIMELEDRAEKEKVWYIEQVNDLKERLEIYKQKTFARFSNEECWIYQEDGGNDLQSLSCPVVIKPLKLLEFEKRIAELEVLVVKAFYAGQKYGFDDAGSVGDSSHEITAQNLDEFLLENGIKQTPPTEAQNG